MLFGNVLELKQICSRSTTTTLFSLRREGKKTYLIMLLLGHLKHRVDVWNEEKKMLGMGLINSVELWVCHFLGTKSCRRSKHAQIYKIKKKKSMNPQTLGHKSIAFGGKKGAPLYNECLGFIGQSQMDFPWSVWCWPLSDTENESAVWENEANLTPFLKFTSAESF